MAEDLNSGRPRNTPSLWSELESRDCESEELTTQPRCLLMVPNRNYNKSKSLNEKRSLVPCGFRVPYFLHASFINQLTVQRSQHRRIRRKRGDRFREPVRNVHPKLNAPNHSTNDTILQSAVFSHTKATTKAAKI